MAIELSQGRGPASVGVDHVRRAPDRKLDNQASAVTTRPVVGDPRGVRFALAAIAVLVSLAGCRGKVLASAELTGPGIAEAQFIATGGKATLWADLDGAWSGTKNSQMEVRYEVELVQNGATIGSLVCDTKANRGSSSVCGTHSDIHGEHEGDCEISLDCPLPQLPAGATVMRVKATTGSNVKSVKRMSLNLRGG